MINQDELLEQFFRRYRNNGRAISISFRDLLPEMNNSDRATHLIHTYPAKLLPHIPFFFLNNTILSGKGSRIIDPFCGSGTVLLEATLCGRIPIGADSNPLARLISRTKISKYDIKQLNEYSKKIYSNKNKARIKSIPNVVNLDYWFLPNVKVQLNNLLELINNIHDESYRDFFLVCFSNLVKKVSLADPRVSVPVKLNPNRYNSKHDMRIAVQRHLKSLENINVKEKFKELVNINIKRFERLNESMTASHIVNVHSEDARALKQTNGTRLRDNSVDLAITSPPYSGAQKYIRSSSLCLGWLGFTEGNNELRNLEKLSIGRENYSVNEYKNFNETGIREADNFLYKVHKIYPQRAHIAGNYLKEMSQSFAETYRVLKKSGYLVLVIGNNQICGREFETQKYLTTILTDLGMKVKLKLIDDIKSYGLMTKRNKTANIITREWILVFQKP